MAYTPIVTVADLITHIYEEQLDEITRDDGGAIAGKAIGMALDEAKACLSRFDLTALFGDPVADLSATVTDAFLGNLVKDIAVWQIVKLGNPSIHYEHTRWCYEAAIEALTRIQQGATTPQNWPLHDTTADVVPTGSPVLSSSIPIRNNYY